MNPDRESPPDHGAARERPRRQARWLVGLIALLGTDLVGDASAGAAGAHLLVQGAAELTILAGIVALWRRMTTARRDAAHLEGDLELALRQTQHWRDEARSHLEGLGLAIDRQFARWHLSAAEREIGLLLLKGLSHKEIGKIRKTNEATVRQQALSLYRKAGLNGRNDLSAFFLEDLLLPAVPVALAPSSNPSCASKTWDFSPLPRPVAQGRGAPRPTRVRALLTPLSCVRW